MVELSSQLLQGGVHQALGLPQPRGVSRAILGSPCGPKGNGCYSLVNSYVFALCTTKRTVFSTTETTFKVAKSLKNEK